MSWDRRIDHNRFEYFTRRFYFDGRKQVFPLEHFYETRVAARVRIAEDKFGGGGSLEPPMIGKEARGALAELGAANGPFGYPADGATPFGFRDVHEIGVRIADRVERAWLPLASRGSPRSQGFPIARL
jgi:hypothetical protein